MSWSIGIATGACVDRPIRDVLATLHHAGVTGIELLKGLYGPRASDDLAS